MVKDISGQELIDMYMDLFGEQPMILTTVSTENETYKEMIGYCNLMGTPLTDEIIVKFFGNKYDVISQEKGNFKQFKKQN